MNRVDLKAKSYALPEVYIRALEALVQIKTVTSRPDAIRAAMREELEKSLLLDQLLSELFKRAPRALEEPGVASMTGGMRIITVSTPVTYLEKFDVLLAKNGSYYPSRSELCRSAVQRYLIKQAIMAVGEQPFLENIRSSMDAAIANFDITVLPSIGAFHSK